MDSTIEEESDGGCQVVSKVTLDQQGFRNENLLSLRRSRRAVKYNVRKKITEIPLFMSQLPFVEELLFKKQEFNKNSKLHVQPASKALDHLVICMK